MDFTNLSELQVHVQGEHNEKLAKCPFCKLLYAFFEYHDHVGKCAALYGHPMNTLTIKDYGKNAAQCEFCDKYFKSKKILKLHKEHEHGLECEYRRCKQVFYETKDLLLHAKEKHGEKLESCPHCKEELSFFHHLDNVVMGSY